MVQTLVAALANRPELASLHHLLPLHRDGSLLFHLLHVKVHGVVCQKRTEELKVRKARVNLVVCMALSELYLTEKECDCVGRHLLYRIVFMNLFIYQHLWMYMPFILNRIMLVFLLNCFSFLHCGGSAGR